MTGFIRGLFGSKSKDNSQQKPQKRAAYFLDSDQAKTYGNIDYMRTTKSVKRTYAKSTLRTKNGVEEGITKQVSATGSANLQGAKAEESSQSTTSFGAASSFGGSASSSSQTSERRRTDSGMDLFRNMAKDIRK